MIDELAEFNRLIMEKIKEYIGDNVTAFNIWFSDFKLVDITDDFAVFTTTTEMRRRVLFKRHQEHIEKAIEKTLGFHLDLKIISLDVDKKKEFEDTAPEVKPQTPEEKEEANERERQIVSFISDKSGEKSVISDYTFENFIEGESNKFAKAACMAVAMEPATIYNPLFIYGNSGLGKTHLLYAVINNIKKNHPKMKIVYKKSEDFTNELVAAIQRGDTPAFKEKYRSADVLLLDDIQFIANKEQTQEEFFHTFSSLYESGKQIILTSDRPPKDIKPLEDRIKTRFEGGLLADVQKPSFELRVAIIKKKADASNLFISDELVYYLAERLQSDIRQIEGAVKKLGAFYSLTNTEITKEEVDKVISQIDPGNIPTEALVERILITVAKHCGVTVEDIKSGKRHESVAKARHIAAYALRQLTQLPLKKIGEAIGRNYTTVISSIEKVEENMKTVARYKPFVTAILNDIKNQCR